jgi:hypothetical protein
LPPSDNLPIFCASFHVHSAIYFAKAMETTPKRRTSARIAGRDSKKQRLSVEEDASASLPDNGRFCYVLDLGSASVWDFLDPQGVCNTLEACPDVFAQDFIDKVALQAVTKFAEENRTHLGRHCECDWMRRLDFHYQSEDRCKGQGPFDVDRNLPILQMPGGAKTFLEALLLTKKLMQPFEVAERTRDATFVPMVCPLTSSETPTLPTKAAVARVMNEISAGTGSRFFYKFKLNSQPSFVDYLEEHWNGMDATSCEYCASLTYRDSLTELDARKPRKYAGLSTTEIQKVRANCAKLYRPLKAALEKHLQFVRFIRRPRRRSRREWSFSGKYRGLVAGVTEGGVLCGLFLVSGFWAHD